MVRGRDPSIPRGVGMPAGALGRAGLVGAALVALAATGGLLAQEPEESGAYRFLFPDVQAFPGDFLTYPIDGEHAEPAQGFSFGARYPSDDLHVLDVRFDDTILDAIGADYFEATVDRDAGSITLGVLVDAEPPFEGNLIPTLNRPLTFFYLELHVADEAVGDLEIRLEDDLSFPPVRNLFSVNDYSISVTEFTSGTITVLADRFVRGDVNLDREVEMTDAIHILGWRYRGGSTPQCMDAADANDDGQVDLSDAVFILSHLFVGGPAPPPPSSEPGRDPSEDRLDCKRSLAIDE